MSALSESAAGLTPESIGLFMLCVILLSKWLWAYNRERREEAGQVEPRISPPLHQTYATKAEHTELKTRVDGLGTEIRSSFMELDRKRSVSIAGLHDDLENRVTGLRHEIKNDMHGLHERLGNCMSALSRLEGRLDK